MRSSNSPAYPEDNYREWFSQIVAAFTCAGIPVDATLERAMEPLLNGQMTFQEHQEYLKTLHDLTH